MITCIDTPDAGSWQRALDRGCLAGRVSDHGYPHTAALHAGTGRILPELTAAPFAPLGEVHLQDGRGADHVHPATPVEARHHV